MLIFTLSVEKNRWQLCERSIQNMYASAYVWAKILGQLEATLGTVNVSNSFDDAEVVELNE